MITFPPISSIDAGGVSNVSVDLEGYLDTGETVSSSTVTTSAAGVLAVSNKAESGSIVSFTLSSATANVKRRLFVYVAFVGSDGNAGTYIAKQQVQPYLID